MQSMTTTNTRDIAATVDQILHLEQVGCEIVRMTVQGMKEAEACELIKSSLLQKGCNIPLVADIHFYPPAAMRVVEFVDKVRINPGNFADKRALFVKKEYDDVSYQEELIKIRETFIPFVQKCKSLKKALRIGANHGSLSDRIMNRYGDTPVGMVESAMEFARLCREEEFHDLVFSMKASNPLVMIEAYRKLVLEMDHLGWDYPLHLGVTEAGEGEDGRIKSALGIGTLLLEGIGDTIRVSLTEDPWEEIAPCKELIALPFEGPKNKPSFPLSKEGIAILYHKNEEILQEHLQNIDGIWLADKNPQAIEEKLLLGIPVFSLYDLHPNIIRVYKLDELSSLPIQPQAVLIESLEEEQMALLKKSQPKWVFFSPREGSHWTQEGTRFYELLDASLGSKAILLYSSHNKQKSTKEVVIEASAVCGSLLVDGFFDGVCLISNDSPEKKSQLTLALLQAARRKTVKTEFISCPGCGRTLFDLQAVTKRIKSRTAHLPGVRIAIMGCIVNGPGEMADADFGYVGSRPGMIDLYQGKECVEKNISFDEAEERLIALIQRSGKWREPVSINSSA